MPQDLEQRIRERAYHLWMADGCRDGEAEQHWLIAERDVLAEFSVSAVTTAAAPKSRTRRRAANADTESHRALAKPRRHATSQRQH
jgi:hypothetical protein